ncbi:MAG: putative sulfate exporter family transporter [Giesbergeria sp.]|nr:putative sulfate exporter family transporter [Giesbergeria sp.]
MLDTATRWTRSQTRGVMLCAMLAVTAMFVSQNHGGPQLLYALLLGLAFHFLSQDERLRPGIDFCSRTLLRAGVALLGLRITLAQVADLGWHAGATAVLCVVMTIMLGVLLARWLGRPMTQGLVSGASVGICGASAALAVSSVLPQTTENERFTLLTVVGVTLMSTAAMVLYPLMLKAGGVSPRQAGIFLGATVHDVAQVVAAGMLLSTPGDTSAVDSATVVKLLRVAMLMPVVLAIAALYRRSAAHRSGTATGPGLVPGFLMAFIAFMLLSTSGWISPALVHIAGDTSRILLVMAIAAAGVKTSFADLLQLGWAPVVMLAAESAFIALVAGTSLALN